MVYTVKWFDVEQHQSFYHNWRDASANESGI
jgi:hypothetical protein